MVYDPMKKGAGIVTMYIDGVPAECSTEASNPNQGAFALGDLPLYLFRRNNQQVNSEGDNESVVCPYYGALDDVRITATALTPDKFMANRSTPKPVALYDFEKETTEDQTGNGHALTFEGGNPVYAYTTSGYCDGCTSLMIYAGRVEKVRIGEKRRDQARQSPVFIGFDRRRARDLGSDPPERLFEKMTAAKARKPRKTSNC